jgi:riboflavin kinase/FMN adenylyltransferase
MQVFTGCDAVPAGYGPSVVGVGNFDGVHCGHRAILARLIAEARRSGMPGGMRAVAITFDPHPLQVLRPDVCPPMITPLPERLALLAETGLDATLVLPFTEEFSRRSAREFAQDVLVETLGAASVHEGDNFRFGYQARAGIEDLRLFGQELGFGVVAHSVLHRRGLLVSSSQVRELIALGDVAKARVLLGRPFSILSSPARGRGIGGKLLVPTINLAEYPALKPADGVYVSRLRVGEGEAARSFAAVTNAGNRPTFGEDSYAIESYLLDYSPEPEPLELTPDTLLELSFLARLREERRFESPEALRTQIGVDVGRALRYHALATALGRVGAGSVR